MPDSVFEERNPVTCPFIFWWPLLRDVKTLEFWNDHSPLISSQRDFPGPSSSLSVRTLFTYLFYFFHHHLWPHTSSHLHPHPSHTITILLPVSLSSFSFFSPFLLKPSTPAPLLHFLFLFSTLFFSSTLITVHNAITVMGVCLLDHFSVWIPSQQEPPVSCSWPHLQYSAHTCLTQYLLDVCLLNTYTRFYQDSLLHTSLKPGRARERDRAETCRSLTAHKSAGCTLGGLEHCPDTQHSRFSLQSGLTQESTKECINKWNNKLMSLSLSLSQINKFLKNLLTNSQ